jgi:hypothetical protein
MALLCLSQTAQAQSISGDLKQDIIKTPLKTSIVKVDLGEGKELIFKEESFLGFLLYEKIQKSELYIDEILKSLQSDLVALRDSLSPLNAYYITYTIDSISAQPTLYIKTKNPEIKNYRQENGQLKAVKTEKDFIEVVDKRNRYTFYLVLNDLSELNGLEPTVVQGYVTAILKDFEGLPKRYKSYILNIDYKAENNTITRTKDDTKGTDYLGINAGLGINLIRDKFVPELDFSLKINIKDIFYIGATASTHYFFEPRETKGFRTLTNLFVGGEFGLNITQNRSNPSFLGVGVEYLVRQRGDFYNPNTMRINLSLPNKSGFKISPQAYYDFDTNDFFWGFKLGKVF